MRNKMLNSVNGSNITYCRLESMKMNVIVFLLALTFCGLTESYRFNHLSIARENTQVPLPSGLSYRELYYKQHVDHFGFENQDTYNMRYLLADQFWNKNGGPIFFYTGNEGDIAWFCNNTGFMWDIAPEFSAMLVFAEHRYYGKSLPYGPKTYQNASNLNFLTAEQALADFAELIRYLKQTIPGAQKSPVVAFGGSYGGMLAAWFRIKYPNIVIGSLAASAPILQFTDVTPCNAFYDTVANTWQVTSSVCAKNIYDSWDTIRQIGQKGSGRSFITKTFKLCSPIKSSSDVYAFIGFLTEMYVDYAMVDYPYPANFLAKLPGWPIQKACGYLSVAKQGKELLRGIAGVTNLYYNYTGDTKCLNWTSGGTGDVGIAGWNYQSCTEMVMPMCNGHPTMFYNMTWDFSAVSENCYRLYKVRPRQYWIPIHYWARQLQAASNIIFSNGEYDPWSSGGVLKSVSDSVVAIWVPKGAHHLDLRGQTDQDPPSIKDVRTQEKNILKEWIEAASMSN